MINAPATLPQATGGWDLDDLARELAGWGWVVRFEPQSFLSGTCAGHLVLTRPRCSKVEHVVTLRRRHEIQVWTRTAEGTVPLGTALGVDEVQELLRQEARESGAAERPLRAVDGVVA